uniref:hypothetical protein n=1 Tax=Castellaniella defragrans TaxID=75697 RepID=UPI003342117F
MTATVYSQWQIPLGSGGRRIDRLPVRSAPTVAGRPFQARPRGCDAAGSRAPGRTVHAIPVGQVCPPSVAGMGFSRARRAVRLRRLALAAGDVVMVLAWAGMIPGLMWLGSAAGF